jgi:IPT/TIG domain-containing protein
MTMVRYPLPITAAMVTPANANAGKPRYDAASVASDWIGGVKGDDKDTSTANVAVARSGGGANEPNYSPRTQAQKAGLANLTPGTVISTDVARPRGWIAPNQPYQGNGAAPAAPVVSSISPNTAAAGSQPLVVTITGTGFTAWSTVWSGGSSGSPWDSSARYVSPTTMTVVVDPRAAVAGTASIAVEDHDLMSNTNINFTFT